MKQLTEELKQQVIQRVEHFVNLANTLHPHLNLTTPTVKFDLCGSYDAGIAYYQTNTIRFNQELLVRNVQYFFDDIIPHEVAHIVQYALHGDKRVWKGNKLVRKVKPHGIEWQQIMKEFGVNPTRCHNMDVSNLTQKRNLTKYHYKCNCRTYSVGSKIHNKIQQGITYTCRYCKTALQKHSVIVVKPEKKPITIPSNVNVNEIIPTPTMTKSQYAEKIYLQYRHEPNVRDIVVSLLVWHMGITREQGLTHFYNAKKKLWHPAT